MGRLHEESVLDRSYSINYIHNCRRSGGEKSRGKGERIKQLDIKAVHEYNNVLQRIHFPERENSFGTHKFTQISEHFFYIPLGLMWIVREEGACDLDFVLRRVA